MCSTRFTSGYRLSPLQGDRFQSDRVPDVSRLATFFTAASRRVRNRYHGPDQTFHVWLPSSPPLHGGLEIDITDQTFHVWLTSSCRFAAGFKSRCRRSRQEIVW